MINISNKYIIFVGLRPILDNVFDTVTEAQNHINKTYVQPSAYKIKKCSDY